MMAFQIVSVERIEQLLQGVLDLRLVVRHGRPPGCRSASDPDPASYT
jgi:hypothetical protein